MSKNLGDKVSRVLESSKRNYTGVVFQQKRPPLDSEFNLLQEIQSDKLTDLIKNTTPSGFLELGPITGSPSDRNQLSASWRNALKFKNPIAVVNGWILHIGAGTNQVQENSLNTIWHEISGDEDEIAIILPPAPVTAHRQDLVFLEVWQATVETSDKINPNGFLQSSLDDLQNDLIDPNINIETTKRTQIQYRFRSVEGVDFESFREGLGHPGARAQGPRSTPNVNYIYRKHSKDVGLYVSGNGDLQSQNDLETTDGYVYAIPVCRVHRKNRIAYSLQNQNGSQHTMISGFKSDRPDGLFYDDISSGDIEDLRHRVSFSGFDLTSLMETSLYDLWSRRIPGELKRSVLDENVVGNKIIQVDAISGGPISGADTSNRIPSSLRRSYTEAQSLQKISLFITSPTLNAGSVWFTPYGRKDNSWEYEMWDENEFFTRKLEGTYRPRIFTFDQNTGVRSEVVGGQWNNLGEYRTYDYIEDACKNKIEFVPANVADIQNKTMIVMIDFYTREGGGVNSSRGGFNYHIEEVLKAENLKDNRPIEFNNFQTTSTVKSLDNIRSVSGIVDSALTRSIARFEQAAIPTNNFSEVFKGACIEVKYNVLSTGSSTIVIPSSVYGRSVAGIYSVFNITSQTWLTPNITKVTAGFEVTGIISSADQVIEFTLLCGNYTSDYVPHTKGINNIASNYIFTNAVNVGETTGVINIKGVLNQCDAALANCGFFNGVTNFYVAYINNRMILLDSIEGFGTPVLKYNFTSPSEVAGQIDIHVFGYYNPVEADRMVFTYTHNPYRGIIRTRMSGSQTERFKILKLDDKIAVTSAGTGRESQLVSEDLLGLISTLPINGNTREYNFFGSNISSPISGGSSCLRRVAGRGGAKTNPTENSSSLYEGQIITVGLDNNISMLRGALLKSPHIHERGFDLGVPKIRDEQGNLLINPETGLPFNIITETDMTSYNHVTQWTAIVESIDSFKGEIFMLVITTTSTVYNAEEGLEHEYLIDKDLWRENSFGKGKETILNSGLTVAEINQRLGRKILGAVDIIPIEGRPLIIPR
jgi:hypothetical protein